jgi:hypothetical protein
MMKKGNISRKNHLPSVFFLFVLVDFFFYNSLHMSFNSVCFLDISVLMKLIHRLIRFPNINEIRGGTFTLLFKSKYFLIYGMKLSHTVSHILKDSLKF